MNCFPTSLRPLILAAGLLTAPTAPAQTAPTDGLIHQWHFDETSGTTATDHIGNLNFFLNDGASFTGGGISGGAVYFDGIDDTAITRGDEGAIFSSNFTLSLWELFTPGVNKLGLLRLFDGKAVLSVDLGFSDPIPVLSANGDQGKTQRKVSIGDGQWHLITLVGSSGLVTLYVDAISSQVVPRVSFPGIVGFALGQQESTHYFSGRIDEVSIYNRALSTSEIAAAAAAPEPGALALIAGVILLAGARRKNLG